MTELVDLLERSSAGGETTAPTDIALVLLMAFVLGQLIAFGYSVTHSGLSYSRAYTQSLVLLCIVVSLVMLVIGNNIITAFGLLGALAIIRFRNVLKDTRDTVFIFLALVVGMAVGSEKYLTAILGTIVTLVVAVYLHVTRFGSRSRFDGHVSLLITDSHPEETTNVLSVLGRFCRRVRQVSVRHSPDDHAREMIFQVRLRDVGEGHRLVEALRGVPGVADVSLVLQPDLSEV